MANEFYKALAFDKLLCSMASLQTVYIPIVAYQNAFSMLDRNEPLQAWKLLNNLPKNYRLPALQRFAHETGMHLSTSRDAELERSSSAAGLFDVDVATGELFLLQPALEHDFALEICPTDAVSLFGNPSLPYLGHSENDGNTVGEYEQKKHFARVLLKYVNDSIDKRQHRLRMWYERKPQQSNGCTRIMFKTPFVRRNNALPLDPHATKTLEILFDMLKSGQFSSMLPVSILISPVVLSQNQPDWQFGWSWGSMRQVLPFFAVNNNAEKDVPKCGFAALNALWFWLQPDVNVVTLKQAVEKWQAEAGWPSDNDDDWISGVCLQDERLFTQPYRLPSTSLVLRSNIQVHRNGLFDRADVAAWVEAVEQAMLQKIRMFVQDAVDSCARRDLSFNWYESLARVSYAFDPIELCFTREDFLAEASENGIWDSKLQITASLRDREQQFEQRVAREVFAEFLTSTDSVFVHKWSVDNNEHNDRQPVLGWPLVRIEKFLVLDYANNVNIKSILYQ